MVTAQGTATMTLVVNGTERHCPTRTTLTELLATLGLDPRMIVVELNRVIRHDREHFASLELMPGDVLELVHFVGGG